MELRQLEYLVTVADEGSFTRAAELLHVTQPGVSSQVRRLEHELGETLLDRSGGPVTPTAAGAEVLPLARAALAAVAGISTALQQVSGLLRGQVRVGSVPSLSGGAGPEVRGLPLLLVDFHEAHPDVGLSLVEDTSARLLEAVAGGRLDLALVGLAGPLPPGVGAQVVIDDTLVALVAPTDPLARRASIPLRQLVARDLICLPPGGGIRGILDSACAAAGLTPRITLEASDPGVLVALAARGLGLAVLPQSATATGLHTLRITGAPMRGQLAIVWRSAGPVSPAARAMVALARATLPDAAPLAT